MKAIIVGLVLMASLWFAGQFRSALLAQGEMDPSKAQWAPMPAQSSRQTLKPLRSDISPTATRIEIVRAWFASSSRPMGATATVQVSVKNSGSEASGRFEIPIRRGRAVVKRVRVRGLAAGRRMTRRVRLRLRGRTGKSCYQVDLRQPSGRNLRLGQPKEACITQVAQRAPVKRVPHERGDEPHIASAGDGVLPGCCPNRYF